MTTFNLTCEAVEATLPDYLDETLEPWVRTSIDEHLGECVRCTSHARELRNIAREAAALPALLPERDVWSGIAGRIGAPVIASGPAAETAPVTPATEPIVVASDAPLPSIEPSAVETEWVVPSELVLPSDPVVASEPLPPSEPVVPSEAPLLTGEPAPVAGELSPPATEPSAPTGALLLSSSTALVRTTVPANALPRRRKKGWRREWMGLAAAALVLVTAGTTFLLTVRWLGPARTPSVASETGTQKPSSSKRAPAAPGIRGQAAGREQVRSGLPTLPPAPVQLGSALTVSVTSVAPVIRSPEDVVYDKEINSLQRIVRRQQAGLDTSTVAVIEMNLRTLDSAIAQIRAALKKDPGSSLLDGQASRALEMKVELLRRAAMLRSNS